MRKETFVRTRFPIVISGLRRDLERGFCFDCLLKDGVTNEKKSKGGLERHLGIYLSTKFGCMKSVMHQSFINIARTLSKKHSQLVTEILNK